MDRGADDRMDRGIHVRADERSYACTDGWKVVWLYGRMDESSHTLTHIVSHQYQFRVKNKGEKERRKESVSFPGASLLSSPQCLKSSLLSLLPLFF